MEWMQELTLDSGGLLVCRPAALTPGDGGQVVDVFLCLKDVQPERRVAAAVSLDELNAAGEAHPRGLRVLALPARHGREPGELTAPPVRFVLPDEWSESGGGPRRLVLRIDAHYMDRGERCPLPEA